MKQFLSLFVVSLLAVAFLLNGCTPSSDAVLKVSRQSLELQGSEARAAFSLSNTGKEDSVLSWKVTSDAAALSVTPDKGTLAAGAAKQIAVTLDRGGLTEGQQFRATLTVDSNGGRASIAVTYTMTEGGLANCGQPGASASSDRSSALSDRSSGSSGTATAASTLPYVAGELLVKFKAPASLSTQRSARSAALQRRALLTVAQTVAADYAFSLSGPVQAERPALVTVPAGADVTTFARRLEADPRVAYAEPNYLLETLAEPNDPRLGEQWNLSGFGLPQAWNVETGDNAKVVVAVIDSGVDIAHVDLQAKVLPGCDFFDKDNNPSPGPQSADPDHGTHVAGIAVAVGNNAEGVAGVAYGASVELLPLKVFSDTGAKGSVDALLDALLWAAGEPVMGVGTNPNPAQIINMSLGVRPSELTDMTSKAVEDMTKLVYDKGVVMFAAAGNDGDKTFIRSPANSPWVYAVGSVDGDYRRSEFSDYASSGATVDFMAPGGTKTVSLCGSILSTFNGDGYGCKAGTSMASPFVAGVAALLLSQTPGLSPSDLKTALTNSALFEPYMNAEEYGAGVVCADRALGAPTQCGR